jgi:hypothetical protein
MSTEKGKKSNFRQKELQQKIEQLQVRAHELRLTAMAGERIGQFLNPQFIQEKRQLLLEVEGEQEQSKKELRKLQLNQIRQRKFREKRAKERKHLLDREAEDSGSNPSQQSLSVAGDGSADISPCFQAETPTLHTHLAAAVNEEEFLWFVQTKMITANTEAELCFVRDLIQMRCHLLRQKQ